MSGHHKRTVRAGVAVLAVLSAVAGTAAASASAPQPSAVERAAGGALPDRSAFTRLHDLGLVTRDGRQLPAPPDLVSTDREGRRLVQVNGSDSAALVRAVTAAGGLIVARHDGDV